MHTHKTLFKANLAGFAVRYVRSEEVWQGVRIGFRLITMMLFALGLCGCLTTFSAGTAARPVDSSRAIRMLDEDLGTDVPTPQLFNFGFDLPLQEEPNNL